MPIARLPNQSIYYETHGSGPWLAFAHGAGGNHLSWWQQVPFFSRNFRCLIFDHPGFGLSPCQGRPDPRDFAGTLEALLDHLGAERTVLVGQSMGGWTALGSALLNPRRVSKLILASTLAGLTNDAMLKTLIALHDPSTPFNEKLALAEDFPNRDPARTFLYQQIASLNPAPDSAFLQNLVTLRYRGEVGKLQVPVFFLAGARDQLFPLDLIKQAQQMVKGATLTVLPEAGHSGYFECPATFNSKLAAFLGIET